MSVRFGFTPIVPPFAGAGQVESVVAEYMAALEAMGGERWDEAGYDDPAPLCLLVATGGTESVVMARREARREHGIDEPALLVAHPGNNSLPASLEVLARLQQDGDRGRIIYLASPDDRAGLEKLAAAVHGVAVRRELERSRIGLVGDPSDWLVASMPTPAIVRAVWGPEVVPVAMAELEGAVDAITAADVASWSDSLVGAAGGVLEPSADEIADVARVYAALRAFVDQRDLDALTLRCFDLVLDCKTTGCFALSELTDAGIIAGCEGDLVSTVTMMWARLLTGETPWMANPSHVDEERNTLLLAHCTVPRSIVEAYTLRSHFESGLGVGIQGDLPLGPVTLVRVGGVSMDEIWLAEGEIVRRGNLENLCRTQVEVTLDRGHVSELLEAPLGNHITVVLGHHADALAEWWEMLL